MSDNIQRRQAVETALQAFANVPLPKASAKLLNSLGYASEKTTDLGGSVESLLGNIEQFKPELGKISRNKVKADRWKSCAFLFQLTNDEITSLAVGQASLGVDNKVARSQIESFVFVAIELLGESWSRTDFAAIARELNRRFPMPAIVIFRHGEMLSLAVIDRRANLKDATKDVIDSRITVIKDVWVANPHRAHLDILAGLALENLGDKRRPANFRELYDAWIEALSTQALNKRFYQELANWYFWALTQAKFPQDAPKDADGRDSLSLIRLITRIIFCWFLKEKGLLPNALFDQRIATLLGDYNPSASTYYKAILQNLFFATLNQEMDKREFRKAGQNFMAHNLYRYRSLMKNPDEVLKLLAGIPFMNGGLFECLDKTLGTKDKPTYVRIDGFSDRDDNPLKIPNELFFGEVRIVDLSGAYGDNKFKSAKVTGLIHILDRYKFTVAENTPIEEEVALDPELLGKAFENLLAAYNPETGATARKQTGSFYTPREIVNYMVDESLIASLKTKLDAALVGRDSSRQDSPDTIGMKPDLQNPHDTESRLRHLFAYNDQPHQFSAAEVETLIEAIDHLKILDPACGSGAFPMGVLHKLVFVLGKLDPGNQFWKARQLAKASEIPDATVRERVMDDIELTFGANELDYGRKLYLIENCIYGVDIQPIAVQISKLRFFISLVVEQKINTQADNLGIRPLPNLETKFVAANTLIGINRPGQQLLRNLDIDVKEAELRNVRERHFLARTPATKAKCREQDATLRAEIAELLKSDGWDTGTARALAEWNPYDQNASANFFDLEWMFGLMDGFDVLLGNPPYVRIQTLNETTPELARHLKNHYVSARKGNYDLYVVFVELGLKLMHRQGQLAYILPHKFFNAQYGEPLRKLLAEGKHLRHVVHFGDQQVFPGATNYVCLLFLSKLGVDQCRFARADDLPAWLAEGIVTEAPIEASSVTAAEWNFAVGKGAALFEKLQQMPVKLGDVANIFVGLQTSADDVFIMNFVSETARTIILESKALGGKWTFEKELLYPIVSGTDVSPFSALPSRQFILFPYHIINEKAELIQFKDLADSWPRAAEYLMENKRRLEDREGGKFRDSMWYRFGRSQNLGIQERVKLCVPRMVEYLHAALDFEGSHFLDNVDVGGVTFTESAANHSLAYLLALLNSRLLRWFFPQVSAPFRGGFRSANKQFLSLLPFRPINFADKAERVEHDALVALVDRILKAKREDATVGTSAWEQGIDEHVYRLYGLTPEEIKIVEESAPSPSPRKQTKQEIESEP